MGKKFFIVVTVAVGLLLGYSIVFLYGDGSGLKGQLGGVSTKFIVQMSSFLPANDEQPTDVLLHGDIVAKPGEKGVQLYRALVYASPQQNLEIRGFTMKMKGGQAGDITKISVNADNALLGSGEFSADGSAVINFPQPFLIVKNTVVPLNILVDVSENARVGDRISLGIASKNDFPVFFEGGSREITLVEKFFCFSENQCNLSGTDEDISLMIE